MKKLTACFRLLGLFIALMAGSTALAQQTRTVTGKVTDSLGAPLDGTTISLRGGASLAATDANGQFTVHLTPGQKVLRFSRVGYADLEKNVGNQSSVSVMMTSVAEMTNEVVVTALGIKREKRSLSYAAQTVSAKDLTVADAPTIAQGLMGKVAGLNITQASGGVEGGSSRIVIRGNVNLTGDNRALIIVDGVPINNQPLNSLPNGSNASNLGLGLGADVSTYSDWGTGLNFINPDDIETVTVLKGASASALYGNRGANGVIVITRKKGGKRPGLGIDYSFSDRFTSVYKDFYNMQDEYGSGFVSSLFTADNSKKMPVNGDGKRYIPQVYGPDDAGDYTKGAGGYFPYDNTTLVYNTAYSYPGGPAWGAKFDGQPVLWYDGIERPYTAQPNNWKKFYPNGFTDDHSVSVSGGGDFGTMRFSYTREDNKANVLNSNYHSNAFNLGGNIKVTSKLTADITASYVNYNRLNSPGIGNYTAIPIYGMPRDYNSDVELANDFTKLGAQNNVDTYSNPPYPFNGGYVDNVFWNTYKNNTTLTHNNLTAGLKLTANATNWLTLTGSAGMDYGNDKTETKKTPTDLQGIAGGQYSLGTEQDKSTDFLGMARFFKDNIGDKQFNASLTLGGESVSIDNEGLASNTNGNFINPFLFNLNNGANPVSTSNSKYAYKINSLFGVVDLSYRNVWFFQFTGRNDWNSTLPLAHASFFYPAGSLAYVFSDGIKGLKDDLPWMSFGKLSVAYAGTGSGTEPYFANNTLTGANYNGTVALTYPNVVTDPNILPQRTRSVDVILNLGFLNNRLNIEVDGYSGTSSPQIVTNPLPASSGVNSIRVNNAKLSNRGINFIINATPVSTKDFMWSISVNAAHSSNKLLSLDGEDSVLTLGSYFGGNGISEKVRVGSNYGTLYGQDFTYDGKGNRIVQNVVGGDGLTPMSYQAHGQTQYLTQWALTPGQVPIGNEIPKLTGGIANTFRYKAFSLYFLTDFRLGGDTYFGSYGAAMGFGLRKETARERDGAGVAISYPDGTTGNDGMVMKGVYADGTVNTQVVPSAWYYTDSYSSWNHIGVPRSTAVYTNSWMKMRELNFSYRIPQRIAKATGVFQSLTVSLIGRDLFYLFTTVPKGVNPEGVNGIGNMQGIEYAAMPNTRSYGFSVKASF